MKKLKLMSCLLLIFLFSGCSEAPQENIEIDESRYITLYIAADSELRSDSGNLIEYLCAGTTVKAYSQKSQFTRIKTPSGSIGLVETKVLFSGKRMFVSGSNFNRSATVYKDKDLKQEHTTLYVGKEVTCIGISDSAAIILIDGETCYVSSSLLANKKPVVFNRETAMALKGKTYDELKTAFGLESIENAAAYFEGYEKSEDIIRLRSSVFGVTFDFVKKDGEYVITSINGTVGTLFPELLGKTPKELPNKEHEEYNDRATRYYVDFDYVTPSCSVMFADLTSDNYGKELRPGDSAYIGYYYKEA